MAIEALSRSQEQGWKDRIAPAVEQVGPATWAIPVPIPNNPLVYTYCYALLEDTGVSLIDPGWDGLEQMQQLTEGLAQIGFRPDQVNGVAITHYHRDHLGLVPQLLQHNPDMWVALQRHDLEALQTFALGQVNPSNGAAADVDIVSLYGVPEERRTEVDRRGAGRKTAGQSSATALIEALGKSAAAASAAPDSGAEAAEHFGDRPAVPFAPPQNLIVMHDQDVLPLTGRTVRGLWTPGHTYGHTAFIDEDHAAFISGDHVLPTITPNIGLDSGSLTHSLGDYLKSLDRMQGLDADLQVLPAHGFRFAGLHERAQAISEHHAQRLDEIRTRLAETDDHSVYSLAQGLHWSRGFAALHDFNLYAALAETAAHMYYLGLPVGEQTLD